MDTWPVALCQGDPEGLLKNSSARNVGFYASISFLNDKLDLKVQYFSFPHLTN